MKMNNIYKEVIDEVSKNDSYSMCDISLICGKIMYKEFLKKYDEKFSDEKGDYDFQKIIGIFEKEVNTMKESNEKKELEAIINAMKLSEFFDGIIKKEKEAPQNAINFDDMKIFYKINNERIDIEYLLNKNINPSFKFYIIKNLQLLKSLINSNLNNNDISELFKNQTDELYIPFWAFLIRNMSSINCINYENKNNLFEKEITEEVRDNIENLLNEGNANQLDNSWLNLILEIIPNEIEMVNVHLFYHFFNNLFEKLNSSDYLKQKIQEILKGFYFELLKYSFEGKIKTILSEDIKNSNKEWYPLLTEYENEKDLFIIEEYTFNSLQKKYNSFKYYQKNSYNNYSYSCYSYNYNYNYNNHGSYSINEEDFYEFLNKYYPYTYEVLKSENKLKRGKEKLNNYLKNIVKKMDENKTLNILKSFKNRVKNNINSFNFTYLAYLIFEKTEDTLNSFISYFPDSIISQINDKIKYILDNLPYGKNNPDLFNETKLDLIKDIYIIFKSKKEGIENNNNNINLLDIDSYDKIYAKISDLKKNFYSYDSTIRTTNKTDFIGKLSQDIEKIIQDKNRTRKQQN